MRDPMHIDDEPVSSLCVLGALLGMIVIFWALSLVIPEGWL